MEKFVPLANLLDAELVLCGAVQTLQLTAAAIFVL
jgi:hypothetical protein